MGLSAGQARLLSITSRKSDCEFQSMGLSHQKIALSRELAELSNEYQNSLDRTKLIYDYYGTGDTTTQLSYGILMTPSVLNDYMPVTLTDTSGRVTLNSKYAAAARAAGIPQEGLGTLPSETMRNAFVTGLCDAGLINSLTADTIKGLPYNQAAGFGGGMTVAVETDSGNIYDLAEILGENGKEYKISRSDFDDKEVNNAKGDPQNVRDGIKFVTNESGSYSHGETDLSFTLVDLLTGDTQYILGYEGVRGEQSPVYGVSLMQNYFLEGSSGGENFLEWIYNELSAVLDLGDGQSSKALEYALTQTQKLLVPNESRYEAFFGADFKKDTDEETQYTAIYKGMTEYDVDAYLSELGTMTRGEGSWDEYYQRSDVEQSADHVGFVYIGSGKGGGDDGNDHTTGGISLNNIAKAFITFFADAMEGINDTDANGIEKYYVKVGSTSNNRLVTSDTLYQYTWVTDTSVSSDDLGQATFYDALFNQICANGWTEDNNIEDKEYLQQMLQSGKLFITKTKEDGYYYQANYSTDSYIKEIADETYIAQAEAKYNTEKAKLNSKEETLDLKMKNLDTEISSLTTEYDTVKNTISKNIEKSFKRYNA